MKKIEALVAIAAFISADAMGFTALFINDGHDLLQGQLWFIAQMLLLCASALGIDYKLKQLKL